MLFLVESKFSQEGWFREESK